MKTWEHKANLKAAVNTAKAQIKILRKEVRELKVTVKESDEHINELQALIDANDGSSNYYAREISMENARKNIFVKKN